MRLKSITILGVGASLTLFCIAVGLYFFGGFSINSSDKKFNLYSLVPQDAMCVVESDNINYYFDEISNLSCAGKFDSIESLDLAKFMLGALNDYCSNVGHGLNSNMGHILLSVHNADTIDNQVLYMMTDKNGTKAIDAMLKDVLNTGRCPNKEKYEGKKIYQYPVDSVRTLSMYKDKDVRVVSFNKNLIHDVIDSRNSGKSLWNDEQFRSVREENISHNYLTLYSNNSMMNYLNQANSWNSYNFQIDSDVIYLTGNTKFQGQDNKSKNIAARLEKVPQIHQDSIILSSNANFMRSNIDNIYSRRRKGINTLFDECVANVSQDASFMMVVDGNKLKTINDECKPFIVPFILNHKNDFSDFILSSQLSLSHNNMMHVIILTYKG